MKVTLLKDIGNYKSGVVDVDEARANYWKAIGVIKGGEVKEKAKAAPKKVAAKTPVKTATKKAPKKADVMTTKRITRKK